MKVQMQPVTFPIAYTVRRVLPARLQLSKLHLVGTMWRPYEAWPAMSNEIRALDIILRFAAPHLDRAAVQAGTPHVVDGAELLQALMRTGALLEAVAEWGRSLALQDQSRLPTFSKGDIDAAQAAAISGIPDFMKGSDLQIEAVRDLILYALKGTAPRRTQLMVASRVCDLLSLEVKSGDDLESVIGYICYLRLLELVDAVLRRPMEGAGTLNSALTIKRDEAYRQRVSALSQLASQVLAIPKSAWLLSANHLKSVITLPWVLKTSFGEMADTITRAIEQHDARAMTDTAFGSWPELAAGTIDPQITGLRDGLVAGGLNAPLPMTAEPPHAGDLGNPLEADLVRVNAVGESAVSSLLDRFWLASAGAERATQYCDDSLGGDPITYGATPVLPAHPHATVEGLLCETQTLDGYPLYAGETDPVRVWSSARFAPRMMKPQLSIWRYYTRQSIVNAITEALGGTLPVEIRGGGSSGSRPLQLLPVFGDLTDLTATLDPGVNAIAKAWGFTLPDLRRYISHLTPSVESNMLRRLADALKFVGVLCLIEKGMKTIDVPTAARDAMADVPITLPGVDNPILPEERHWYHGIKHEASLDLARSHLLGTLGSNSDQKDLWLVPFKALPSTSRWSQAWLSLGVQAANTELNNRSIVRWVSGQPSRPRTPITAWKLGDPALPIWDIIGVDTGNNAPRELILMGRTDKRPTALRHENAVMSLLPAGLPAFSPTTVPIPAPADVFEE